MNIQIENLKAQMTGRKLNIYQKADALIEFNKLLDYVDELEQLPIHDASGMLPLAVEFGYKQCEKGNNIQKAMIEWNKLGN